MTIRAPKDFWSGIMFLAFAAVALLTARGYSLGSAGRMGPGYFPVLLGSVMAVLGTILVVRSLAVRGEPLDSMNVAPLAIIAFAVCLFGATIDRLGLVIAVVVVTVVSALAYRQWRPLEFAGLAIFLAAFSVGVFVYALRLPLPIWPAF